MHLITFTVVSVAAFFITYAWLILSYFAFLLHALHILLETEHFILCVIAALGTCPPQGGLIIFICLVSVSIILMKSIPPP